MKVFLYNAKIISAITRKEEITEDTFLISNKEEELINETLKAEGHFWITASNELGISGAPPLPHEDYIWDNSQHKWLIDNKKKNARLLKEKEKTWEKIKLKRDYEIEKGVYIKSLDKWFHSDKESEFAYQQLMNLLILDQWENTQWKTKNGDFVLMTKELLKDIQVEKFKLRELNYANAERHKALLWQSVAPLDYEYQDGWV